MEMNTGDGKAAVVARACSLLPGEPVHPAAAAASTTLSPAYPIGRAAFLQAVRPALSYVKPSAEVTRRWRPLRSQNQFMFFPPLTVGLVRPL